MTTTNIEGRWAARKHINMGNRTDMLGS